MIKDQRGGARIFTVVSTNQFFVGAHTVIVMNHLL